MVNGKPNIFLITIDSLRSDHCFGNNRTTQTPNIDNLIAGGAYFTQAISSADQTGTSLASIYTGLSPSTSGLTHFNFSKEVKTYFNYFKEYGYYTSGYFPDHDFFINLGSNLDEKYFYVYSKLDSWKNLSGGIGDSIVDKLKLLKKHQPWLFSVHIMDLHNLFVLPKEYDDEKYGKNNYEKMLSFIDFWIGKFLQNVDLKNTLIIISSDHGSYIPLSQTNPDEIPQLQNFLKSGKKIAPKLEPIGIKFLLLMRKLAKEIRMKKLKNKYSEYELRSLNNRGKSELFDETIRVPLILTGPGIQQSRIINDLVRHVDIFPTISEIVNLENNQFQIDGHSLVSLLNNKKFQELPAYIETGVSAGDFSEKVNPKSKGNIVGLRTSSYKYLRARDNSGDVILFDLKNDPKELINVSSKNPEIVKEMEEKLSNLLNPEDFSKTNELTKDEQEKAEDLLRKLGYI
jgi:N-acetylglucosamine-6-sulfatase